MADAQLGKEETEAKVEHVWKERRKLLQRVVVDEEDKRKERQRRDREQQAAPDQSSKQDLVEQCTRCARSEFSGCLQHSQRIKYALSSSELSGNAIERNLERTTSSAETG